MKYAKLGQVSNVNNSDLIFQKQSRVTTPQVLFRANSKNIDIASLRVIRNLFNLFISFL